MISRRSARAIAELLEVTFRTYHRHGGPGNPYYSPDKKRLYDFLFDNGYAAWFCNLVNTIQFQYKTHEIKELFMRVHTGETLAAATQSWSWEQREALGQRYLTDLAEDLLQHWKDGPPRYGGEDIKARLSDLRGSLELDGYVWDEIRLLRPEEDAVDAAEEIGVVQTLYREAGLGEEATAFHHLQLAEEHYLGGRWDDSISNSRKFLEATLQQIAAKVSVLRSGPLGDDELSRPVRVRDYLEREGLLEEKEKHTVASVYGLLSETGSHPYVAAKEQARLMRHLALTFAQFVLLRLRGLIAAG